MNTTENTTSASPQSGRVKWFDPAKGFGFVVSDTGGPDVLLHANVLRNFGQGSVVDETVITMDVQQSDRGLQVVEILSLTPPDHLPDVPMMRDMEDISFDVIQAQPVVPARVKWFDKVKGFGFANIFGDSADVFVHIEVLRRCGLSDLQAGEAIGLRSIDGNRGRMAVDVVSWEAISK
ncbi:MAG: cold shock domain-containing protein [Yoonia sp.]|nr:cold shock domain-containing protein [Yoonia sp.]